MGPCLCGDPECGRCFPRGDRGVDEAPEPEVDDDDYWRNQELEIARDAYQVPDDERE